MILEKITVGPMEANCYIFGDQNEIVIIDPGADYGKISALLTSSSLKPMAIINTHGHADHIGANRDMGLPVWIHGLDADFLTDPAKNLSALFAMPLRSPAAESILKNADVLKVGELDLEVIHTPGHTPGSICLRHNNIIFTGDTLFHDGVGRTDLPYGSEEELLKSIKTRLLIYDDATIYPGHGPSSTIAWEKKNNPFLVS